MKSKAMVVLAILLSGCASSYVYVAKSDKDPDVTFGDRFGGGKIASPARTFLINTTDAAANKCKDFAVVGTTSNHWMHVNSKTKEIRIPADRAVAIASSWLFGASSCNPPTIMFKPEEAGKYSVDIGFVGDKCYLSIMKNTPDGKQEEIAGKAALPVCIKS